MPLSKEEENYIRLSLLLTGISPRAVRILFDGTFQPSSLEKTIKKNYNKISDLKQKKAITSPQWSLMFPVVQGQTGTPDSTTFDVTLMITLLRNCSKLTIPQNGYDDMPAPYDVTPAADLARIKYYRNYLAHSSENKITTNFFKTAWDEISSAVMRLGNQQLKDECDELKYKVLDQSNTKILKEIEASQEEIRNLQYEFDTFQLQVTSNIENWHFKIPRNVKIQFASETSLKVEWEPPEHTDHLQSYKVYWKKTSPDATENCKDVPKEENCTTVDGLTEMTNYWIRISAYSLNMQASSPQQSFRTTKGIPTRPPKRVICIPHQDGRSVEINWEPPSSGEMRDLISGYTVYLQQHSDENEEEIKDTSVGSSIQRTVLEGLLPFTKYKAWISARSQYGYGPPSETKIFNTTASSSSGGINLLSNVGSVDLGGGSISVNFGGYPPQDIQGNINLSNQTLSVNQQNQLSLNQSNTRMSICPSDNAATSSGESQRKRIKMDE